MILYKYRDWNYMIEQNGVPFYPHRTLLTDCALWFSSCKHFNDPFDMKIGLAFDSAHEDDLARYFMDALNRRAPNAQQVDKAASVQSLVAHFSKKKSRETIRSMVEDYLASDFGVCTLSRKSRSILMWAHYADRHRGFCVGLDRSALIDRFAEYLLSNTRIIFTRVVEYSRKYPFIEPWKYQEGEEHEWALKILSTKAKDWRYEAESRCILEGQSDIAIPIPRSTIKEVILGCQMPDKHRQEIIEVLQAHPERPTLYQAKKKDLEFGLDFEEVPY